MDEKKANCDAGIICLGLLVPVEAKWANSIFNSIIHVPPF